MAPNGVLEDYHAIRVVFEASVPGDAPPPRVIEQDGTTSAVSWVPLEDISTGRLEVVELVRVAISAHARRD